MRLLIKGATVIDGISDEPLTQHSVLIDGKRIGAIAREEVLGTPESAQVIQAQGKYVIPGLMNANVHLLAAFNLESLLREVDRFEELIAESAQIALRGGLTTVFDTWGPRRFLVSARDRIDGGKIPGSRIFCAGNIMGFDGPFSPDFLAKAAEVVGAGIVKRINAIWVENVGRRLMWLTPEQVASEAKIYIERGIDFVKYASNDHYPGAFLAFSPAVQAAIVETAHRHGRTAQAHAMSVEGLRIALEAGCDLVTHCNITGPVPIPNATLDSFAKQRTGAVIFTWTRRALAWIGQNCSDLDWNVAELNARHLISCGAKLLFANDGAVYPPELKSDPAWAKWSIVAPLDNMFSLEEGHFTWAEAMEEKGCEPMRILKAMTHNIADAYGKAKELGSLESGKLADLLILEKNPLEAATNYRSLATIIKEGTVVDRNALPVKPIWSRGPEGPVEEEARYVPFTSTGAFPACPMCFRG